MGLKQKTIVYLTTKKTHPTNIKTVLETNIDRCKYLRVAIICEADLSWYGKLMEYLHNNVVKGNNTPPPPPWESQSPTKSWMTIDHYAVTNRETVWWMTRRRSCSRIWGETEK